MKHPIEKFYLISLVLSYLIIDQGNFSFEWWIIVGIPIYALWLNVPIIFGKIDEKDNILYIFLGYFIWVGIQGVIYYFGMSPPEGIGIPHF